ncbi:MAG: hypothetical protein E7607_02115 [Ruminococcaceae bacterium]|nr:hypothetical protein [Oscillospiraceae bacterium]
MLYTYSVTPLLEDHFEKRVADLVDQHKRNISTCPLFSVVIQPQGDPVWNRSKDIAKKYARYKKELDKHGVPSGILLQSTFGHGTASLEPAPYQFMEPLDISAASAYSLDGKSIFAYCPKDERTLDHLCEEIKTIAKEGPSVLMLDDDVRLIVRPGYCCACPAHMAEFNKRCGTNHTKETLYKHLLTCGEKDPLAKAFVELQRETLVHAVTRFREAVDSVDPTIQGINCTSGDECDSVIYTNPIWCGKGNPTIVRTPNGTYAPESVKTISDTMRRAAVCGARLHDNGIQIALAECDTIPYNRYGKNARYLHTHFTASILEGLKGSKHWITRMSSYEPSGGVAFRDILAKHSGLYEKLSTLSDELTFVGANSAFTEQKWYNFGTANRWRYHSNFWASKIFERLGLPFYFSNKHYGATFLEDTIGKDLPDGEIKNMFNAGSVFMSAEVARDLCDRGYGNLIGVTVTPFDYDKFGRIEYEAFTDDASLYCQKQKNLTLLTPISENTETVSYNFRRENGALVNVSPAVTKFNRGDGKFTVVYCGTPDAEHKYTEGFSFLNETRKQQFISLLKDAGALPVYMPSDNELCLRAGYLKDGTLLAAIFNLSYDPEEKTVLYLEKEPKSVSVLDENGNEVAISFEKTSENFYTMNVACDPLYPTILLIK